MFAMDMINYIQWFLNMFCVVNLFCGSLFYFEKRHRSSRVIILLYTEPQYYKIYRWLLSSLRNSYIINTRSCKCPLIIFSFVICKKLSFPYSPKMSSIKGVIHPFTLPIDSVWTLSYKLGFFVYFAFILFPIKRPQGPNSVF